MQEFMYWLKPATGEPIHRVQRAPDVVVATEQVCTQYPQHTVLACWQLHDVQWAVREVLTQRGLAQRAAGAGV